jgi:hypothetical protein
MIKMVEKSRNAIWRHGSGVACPSFQQRQPSNLLAIRDSSFTVVASRIPSRYGPSNATWLGCDMTKPLEIKKALESVKPTIVIHTATPGPFAMMGAQAKPYDPTKTLLREARKSKSIKAFIYTGSMEIIANGTKAKELSLKEEDAVFHSSFYEPTLYTTSEGTCQSLVLQFNSPPNTSSIPSIETANVDKGFRHLFLTIVLCVTGIHGPRDTVIMPCVFKLPIRLQLGPYKCEYQHIRWGLLVELTNRPHPFYWS